MPPLIFSVSSAPPWFIFTAVNDFFASGKNTPVKKKFTRVEEISTLVTEKIQSRKKCFSLVMKKSTRVEEISTCVKTQIYMCGKNIYMCRKNIHICRRNIVIREKKIHIHRFQRYLPAFFIFKINNRLKIKRLYIINFIYKQHNVINIYFYCVINLKFYLYENKKLFIGLYHEKTVSVYHAAVRIRAYSLRKQAGGTSSSANARILSVYKHCLDC
jgi:hypothetical protein